MTNSPILPQSLEDAESRMGIDPIETLLADRADLIKRVAPLRARHGMGGTYGDQRKIMLSQVAALKRANAIAEGVKMTEAAIDEAAHADSAYIQFVTNATNERVEFIELEDQIQAIQDRILRANAVARYLAAEAHL